MFEGCGHGLLNPVCLVRITLGTSAPDGKITASRLEGAYTDIDDDFNPAVGYVRRNGIRNLRGRGTLAPKASKIRYSTGLDKDQR